jgi:syntaxin 1B/2/3
LLIILVELLDTEDVKTPMIKEEQLRLKEDTMPSPTEPQHQLMVASNTTLLPWGAMSIPVCIQLYPHLASAERETNNESAAGQNVEMEPLTANSGQYGYPTQNDPNKLLNECREVDNGISHIRENLKKLRDAQGESFTDDGSKARKIEANINALSSETMAMYRALVNKVKKLKQQPESGSPRNAQQIGRVDRELRKAIGEYQDVDRNYRKKLEEQMARQYRIVSPDASEAEVKRAVEDRTGNQQVFANALMQSDRRGESLTVMKEVKGRHAEIQKIEAQITELGQLFQDMDALVVQQEAAVENIEMKGEEVVTNLDEGTKQISTAIVSARNARKYKWWCCGIAGMSPFPLYVPTHAVSNLFTHSVVLIVVIIVVAVVAWCFASGTCKGNSNKKRWLQDAADSLPLPVRSISSANEPRFVVPGLEFTEDNTLAPVKDKRECMFRA